MAWPGDSSRASSDRAESAVMHASFVRNLLIQLLGSSPGGSPPVSAAHTFCPQPYHAVNARVLLSQRYVAQQSATPEDR
jgi:hypothetical protein